MTTQEFSEQWDIMYNNIASNAAPGLDEYEKSVFLTEAQKEVVLALYNGTLGYGFEANEANRKYLAPLVKTVELGEDDVVTEDQYIGLNNPVFQDSTFFKLPKDLWFITYESATVSTGNCLENRTFDVIPVTQDMFAKTKDNPFRGPNKRNILKLDVQPLKIEQLEEENAEPGIINVVELVSDYDIDTYLVRYIRSPKPIILLDISKQGLYIDGQQTEQTSELNPILHKVILETAIRKAYAIRPQ